MAHYELTIIRTPNGRYTFVGNVPIELCETRFSKFYGEQIVAPLVYDDYESALRAKLNYEEA